MFDALDHLHRRIKGSSMYIGEKDAIKRLFIPSLKKGKYYTKVWFEIVNDKLTPFIKTDLGTEFSNSYERDIYVQFHEIIYNCELERKKIPLNIRLCDNVIPSHQNSLKHQADALRFCCSMKVSALFADTGTGKSKIAIDLCISRFEALQIKKVLIICPVSTKKNFKDEINKWAKETSIEWKIIGHETIGSSDRTIFELLEWVDSETQIIIDESHLIKNPIAKRSKRIKLICEKTSYKLVMTGTPVSENVHNLYMQYAVLSELIINVPNWLKFEDKYCIVGGRTGTEIIGYKNLNHLMGLLEPYTFQIDKSECLDLPALYQKTKSCYLNNEQSFHYAVEKERLLELIKNDNVSATDIFFTFTKMQQISSGLYKGTFIGTEKLSLLSEIEFQSNTVIFCKYLFEVNKVVELLKPENCAIFTGNNPKERDAELTLFSKQQKKFFVATMQSEGTGLNGLQTVSSQVIFFSNSFSYLQRKQSIGRIDRKGQMNEMEVIDLHSNCGIDSRIMETLNRKGNLSVEINALLADKTKLKQYVNSL